MLIRDYFRGRCFSLVENYHNVRKELSVGCPVSVLDLKLWNLVMDYLLEVLYAVPHVHPIAYADDLVIVVPGDSRNYLEHRASAALQTLTEWARENKLKFQRIKQWGYS